MSTKEAVIRLLMNVLAWWGQDLGSLMNDQYHWRVNFDWHQSTHTAQDTVEETIG